MKWLILIVLYLLLFGMISWELATGKALDRTWKVAYRRGSEPKKYWALISAHIVMSVAFISYVTYFELFVDV